MRRCPALSFARTSIATLAITLSLCLAPVSSAWAESNTVIVVLIDGLAPSIVKAADTPNLDRLAEEGSYSSHLIPEFPSMSMVNHTSFTTGCRPKNHGIMSNIFIDPERGRYEGSPDADWRTGCMSMWEIAEREDITSAALGITGAHSTGKGATATHTLPHNSWDERLSDEAKLEHALSLLATEDAERPRLIVLYLSEPDNTAHDFGTLAPETLAATTKTDVLIGNLLAAIDALPSGHQTTLLIGADHGMNDVSPLINIRRIMNRHSIRGEQASDGASAFLYLEEPSDLDRAYERLSTYEEFEVFKRGDHPAYSNLGDGPRTGDLLIVTRPPYWIAGEEVFPLWAKLTGITRLWPDVFVPPMGSGLKATHGYPPTVQSMHTSFYAWGPEIRRNHQIERLDMIDVAPTALHILGVDAAAEMDGVVITEIVVPN